MAPFGAVGFFGGIVRDCDAREGGHRTDSGRRKLGIVGGEIKGGRVEKRGIGNGERECG